MSWLKGKSVHIESPYIRLMATSCDAMPDGDLHASVYVLLIPRARARVIDIIEEELYELA